MLARGTPITPFTSQPLTQDVINAYAAASGDDNPVHTDEAFVRAAGLDAPIVHGMLLMALTEEALRATWPELHIHSLTAKFMTPVLRNETVTITGKVVAEGMGPQADQSVVRLFAARDAGGMALVGEALVALPAA